MAHTIGKIESITLQLRVFPTTHKPTMSDLEFDVLDELYFVTSYHDVASGTGLEDFEIKPVLMKLFRKGWIRCYEEPDTEVNDKEVDLEVKFRSYYYLASKEGLMAHNRGE